jgi:hypothetical protein
MDEFNNEKKVEADSEAVTVMLKEDNNTVDDVLKDLEQTEKKSKVKLQTPIIIAACVLVVAVLAFFCFKLFFSNSVVGTWVVKSDATSDEATEEDDSSVIYYTFNSDNTASLTIGTMQVKGEWWYSDESGATTDQPSDNIYISISYFFNGIFQYDLNGNSITGRELTLTSSEGTAYDFVYKEIPESTLKPADDFKADEDLIGKWNNASSNITYEFNKDGTCHINQMDTLFIDGVYSVNEEGKVDITYLAQDEANTSIEYSISGSTVTISGMEYEKVTE